MKKLLLLAIVLLVLGIVGWAVFKSGLTLQSQLPGNNDTEPTGTVPTTIPETSFDQGKYKTKWIVVRDPSKITLHSNLEEQLTAQEALQKHSCVAVVSGGFYSKENTHIGQFLAEGVNLSQSSTNALFNGYVSVPKIGRPTITFTANTEGRIGLQAGPMLFAEKRPLTLSLEKDGAARRIVAATTREGHLALLVIYDSSSLFSGPLLADLPKMLDKIQKGTPLQFNAAINLDGGTASAFITDTATITEGTRIGSYFCIKP